MRTVRPWRVLLLRENVRPSRRRLSLRHPSSHTPQWSLSLYVDSKSRSFATTTIAEEAIHDEPSILDVPNPPQQIPLSEYKLPKLPATFSRLIEGPPIQFGTGKLARLTHSSVVGQGGSTVVLATVAHQPPDTPNGDQNNAASTFLTVDYRQRYHGVGKIPSNGGRRDNAVLSTPEVLASRAIDRALRPLIRTEDAIDGRLHVTCSVQSYEVFASEVDLRQDGLLDEKDNDATNASHSTHPVAMALNTAAAALLQQGHLTQPVAATVLAVAAHGDGVVWQDPVPEQLADSYGELLYAGTADGHVVMLEWTSHRLATGLSESHMTQLLELAQTSIRPVLDLLTARFGDVPHNNNSSSIGLSATDRWLEENQLRQSLGLDPIPQDEEAINLPSVVASNTTQARLPDIIQHVQTCIGHVLPRLFGWDATLPADTETDRNNEKNRTVVDQSMGAAIHRGDLPSKTVRGRREQIVQTEIARLVESYVTAAGDAFEPRELQWLSEQTTKHLLQKGFVQSALQGGARADGRGLPGHGWKTIRPLKVQMPALPDTVHGSALFARGDTQVLCTATLGPPGDGQPMKDPYLATDNPRRVKSGAETTAAGYYSELPVGSLRFLRTQESLVSDMNSRKVKADKERTGDSGSLAEVKRAFLQYDFPPYATGTVPIGSQAHNRRAIGHGALAEKALLPVLPDAHDFPYAIRISSEVTDSNGSSSMASVCGGTLALLDAGVPIQMPVAGVSVGLARDVDAGEAGVHRLLLDITGTEDYYGGMDFKIAGTRKGITAFQLDVKQLLPLEIVTEALQLACRGRNVILNEMQDQCSDGLKARPSPKDSAPRVEVVRFNPQRKRDLVGPGGIILRQLEDRYGVALDLTQEGRCLLFGADQELVDQAKLTVMDLVADVVPGEVYEGTIIEIKDFGAIVELLRNKEGLLHVSELTNEQEAGDHPGGIAGFVRQYLKEGQKVEVLCTDVDPVQGSIRLSRKAILVKEQKKAMRR